MTPNIVIESETELNCQNSPSESSCCLSSRVNVSFDFQGLDLKVPSKLLDHDQELKEWIWSNHKETILKRMSILNRGNEMTEFERIQRKVRLLDNIATVQRKYLQMEDKSTVFGTLLEGLLDTTESEYGFIGEVKYLENGRPYLHTHAYTKIAWNEATAAFYEEYARNGLKFYNMNTLFGHVILNATPVIANNAEEDPRGSGVPEGHPPLTHFLGIPFFETGGSKMIGMVGLANKPGGYSEADIEFLEPFTDTSSNLIQAYNAIQENKYLINTLEEKVEERTKELQSLNESLALANQRVVQASEAQLQHFACMSHEIRTPLNCIIGLSNLLQDTKLTPYQDDSLKMIVSSGDLLLAVVNDVLDYSKLESGNLEITTKQSSLQEALDAVVHSISQKARSKNLKVETFYGLDLPEFIDTDSRRLQQILYNLLGNATKFSKDGGTIELHVNLLEHGSLDYCNRAHRSGQAESATIAVGVECGDLVRQKSPHLSSGAEITGQAPCNIDRDSSENHVEGSSAFANESQFQLSKSVDREPFVEKGEESQTSIEPNRGVLGASSRCPFSFGSGDAQVSTADSINGCETYDKTSQVRMMNEARIPRKCPFSEKSQQNLPLNDAGAYSIFKSCGDAQGESADNSAREACNLVGIQRGGPSKASILRFSVKDFGSGIKKEDFSRIFKPFKQATCETERVQEGTGLGLAITSRLVDALGGIIGVDSVKDEWTEFTIEFPYHGLRADIRNISESLQGTTVLQVAKSKHATTIKNRLLDPYSVSSNSFTNMMQLKAFFDGEKGQVRRQTNYICLIDEDLYESEIYDSISHLLKMALVTFGPNYAIKSSRHHFRSILQVLPSVFMGFLATAFNCQEQIESLSKAERISIYDFGHLKTLVAEDNPINQKILVRMLRKLGAKVDVVENGLQAVQRAAEQNYDLILMDMQMPVMDGINACRLIAQRRQNRLKPKVIFVTANLACAYESHATDAGGDGFISKPFKMEEIEQVLKLAVDRSSRDDSSSQSDSEPVAE